MKNLALLALGALLPLGAISVAAAADDTAPSMDASKAVTVPIAQQNDSKESGTATLTQNGKDVVVVLALDGAGAGPQPVHVHTGTCADLNPAPKYPLTNLVDGKSTTTLKGMTLADLQTGGFAINVHKSTDDLKTYVACGDIPKLSSSSM